MRRGEVWSVNLDPTVGSEIKKTRPAVIVNRDSIGILPLKIIVPLTGWQESFSKAPWLVPIERTTQNGLSKKSAADTFQLRSISEQRLVSKLGELSHENIESIEDALRLTLQLD